jgi:hypothetical protein
MEGNSCKSETIATPIPAGAIAEPIAGAIAEAAAGAIAEAVAARNREMSATRIPKQNQQGFRIVRIEAKGPDFPERFMDNTLPRQSSIEQNQLPISRKHGQPPSIG